MATIHEKILLVEGDEDKRVIPELVEANGLAWGDRPKDRIVHIKSCGGVEQLIDKAALNTELKASGLKILGMIVDADEAPEARWQSIRNALLDRFPEIPSELPGTGLISTNTSNIKVGVWMMPDNRQRGMLETFFEFLLPETEAALWDHAKQSCLQAATHGAAYRQPHTDKANIHTWLAWQNPPGRQLHQAVKERILNPSSAKATIFMDWFRELYEVS